MSYKTLLFLVVVFGMEAAQCTLMRHYHNLNHGVAQNYVLADEVKQETANGTEILREAEGKKIAEKIAKVLEKPAIKKALEQQVLKKVLEKQVVKKVLEKQQENANGTKALNMTEMLREAEAEGGKREAGFFLKDIVSSVVNIAEDVVGTVTDAIQGRQ